MVPDVVRFFAPMSARATPLHTLQDLNNSLYVPPTPCFTTNSIYYVYAKRPSMASY